MLRKVKFKAFVKGKGWSPEFSQHGKFHQWAFAYDEFQQGPGNYTVGLIELADGTVVSVPPEHIRFIEHEPKKKSNEKQGQNP